MRPYSELSKEDLIKEKNAMEEHYKKYKESGLSLNMARGKPAPEQLDLSMEIFFDVPKEKDITSLCELDPRNYGGLEGLKDARKLIAEMVYARPEQVIMFGSSSLNIMFDTISRAMNKGIMGHTPWHKLDKVKFLCPVPGYDRHFAVTEYFGIEMINVPMHEDGPDMDMVEELVKSDPSIKGIWCVPKFSNPQGYVYSDETVERMANLEPAAPDFRIFWDNAYCVHYLYDEIWVPNILDVAKKYGKEDMIFKFVSTSKISFAGGGISALITSEANVADTLETLKIQTINYDKVNQLRHVIFFKDMEGIKAHMKKHAAILRPKFETVLNALNRDLKELNIAKWIEPKGGYFITLDTLDGCAARTIALAKEAGLTLTEAGAPFPYHKDPHDSCIRIAPSFPSLEELKTASDLLTICIRLATLEKMIESK